MASPSWLASGRWRRRENGRTIESEALLHHWPRGALRAAALVLPTGAAALLAWSVPQVPGDLIAFGRYLPTWNGQGDLLYVGEGVNASVGVSEW